MKIHLALASIRARLGGVVLLSSVALFSSFYLEYVKSYRPCVYCYALRYLTIGILLLSVAGLVSPRLARNIATLASGASLVGVGVSTFLIFDELFPSAGICSACAFSPFIMGISLYYYSFAYMALVLGLSISIALKKEEGS